MGSASHVGDTMAFEHRNGRIVAVYATRNPERLGHVRF
jgi:hypothetical protein